MNILELSDDGVLIRDLATKRIRLMVSLPPHDPTKLLIVTSFIGDQTCGDWGISPEQALAFCGAVCGLAIKAKVRASRTSAGHGPQGEDRDDEG